MKAVVDTNVLLVANASHPDISPACIDTCIAMLQALQEDGTVVIDDGHLILTEYLEKTSLDSPKGLGDVFLKWLLQQLANPARVAQVRITPDRQGGFKEFPDKLLQQRFDPPDRMFVAVANAHPERPPILQAGDCKWLDWWQELALYGVRIDFLCPDDVCRFYQHKFPDQPLPPLPEAKPAAGKPGERYPGQKKSAQRKPVQRNPGQKNPENSKRKQGSQYPDNQKRSRRVEDE